MSSNLNLDLSKMCIACVCAPGVCGVAPAVSGSGSVLWSVVGSLMVSASAAGLAMRNRMVSWVRGRFS